MSNYPNSSRAGSAACNPTPDEVIALRLSRGWTQTEAAKHWMTTINAVQKWEAPVGTLNHRRVHPLMWWAMKNILLIK